MLNFITWKSIQSRKFTTLLCVISIALSVTLFLGIERIRNGAKDGFTNTISKTDFIVGAKGSPLQLLLYSVFHIGGAVNNIKIDTYNDIKNNPIVEWTIPFSLGDSYRGYRVVATNESFYLNYRFRGDHSVEFSEGELPNDTFDVALGAEVAKKLNLKLGEAIVLSHGIAQESLLNHDQTPFKIKAILKSTQTPIDTGVYITLEGMEALHFGWESGVPDGEAIAQERFKKENIEINQITSFLVKLKSRIAILKMRRDIDLYSKEPIMAVIPGLALQEMWETIGYVEKILFLVSICVTVVGVLGIIISLYTSINERRREMAILRSLGAKSRDIFFLLLYESALIVFFGCLLGVMSMFGITLLIRPWLESNFSVYIPLSALSKTEWIYLGAIFVTGTIAGIIPAIKAYMYSLRDGLSPKI